MKIQRFFTLICIALQVLFMSFSVLAEGEPAYGVIQIEGGDVTSFKKYFVSVEVGQQVFSVQIDSTTAVFAIEGDGCLNCPPDKAAYNTSKSQKSLNCQRQCSFCMDDQCGFYTTFSCDVWVEGLVFQDEVSFGKNMFATAEVGIIYTENRFQYHIPQISGVLGVGNDILLPSSPRPLLSAIISTYNWKDTFSMCFSRYGGLMVIGGSTIEAIDDPSTRDLKNEIGGAGSSSRSFVKYHHHRPVHSQIEKVNQETENNNERNDNRNHNGPMREVQSTPIIRQTYYTVETLDIRVNGISLDTLNQPSKNLFSFVDKNNNNENINKNNNGNSNDFDNNRVDDQPNTNNKRQNQGNERTTKRNQNLDDENNRIDENNRALPHSFYHYAMEQRRLNYHNRNRNNKNFQRQPEDATIEYNPTYLDTTEKQLLIPPDAFHFFRNYINYHYCLPDSSSITTSSSTTTTTTTTTTTPPEVPSVSFTPLPGFCQGETFFTSPDGCVTLETFPSKKAMYPNVTIHLQNSTVLTLYPTDYIQRDRDGRYCLRISENTKTEKTTIGTTVLEAYHVTIDRTNQRMEFSRVLGDECSGARYIITDISGNHQDGYLETKLKHPFKFVVRTLPRDGSHPTPVSGVIVRWRVVSGNGTLSRINSTTDSYGSVSTYLTLGSASGQNKVYAYVDYSSDSPVIFSAEASQRIVLPVIGSIWLFFLSCGIFAVLYFFRRLEELETHKAILRGTLLDDHEHI